MIAWLSRDLWGVPRWAWLLCVVAALVCGAAFHWAAVLAGAPFLLLGRARRRDPPSMPDPIEVVRADAARYSAQVDEEVRAARAAREQSRVDDEADTERLQRLSLEELAREVEETRRQR